MFTAPPRVHDEQNRRHVCVLREPPLERLRQRIGSALYRADEASEGTDLCRETRVSKPSQQERYQSFVQFPIR
jgi:hypothetical protein